VPVMLGRQPNSWLQYWFGPKFMFSALKLDENLVKLNATDDVRVNMAYLGGTAGIALGYKYVWVMFEMTATNLFLNAEVLAEERDLGGLVVYPAFGLMTRF
jgi:hypothetical protein